MKGHPTLLSHGQICTGKFSASDEIDTLTL